VLPLLKIASKVLVFLLCLAPATWLAYVVWLAYTGGENLLGPDPAITLALETGTWAMWLLLATLAVTPLRFLFDAPWLWSYRRMLGLFAFFYVCLHFTVFLVFLLQWQWRELALEIAERPFITFGFAAFLLMLPMAMTSFLRARQKLGKHWKRLHRLIYLISILAVLHVVWIIRSSIADALLYASIVALLLAYRVLLWLLPRARYFNLPGALRSLNRNL